MKKILAIRDSDITYAEQLAKALNKIEKFPFKSVLFNDEGAFLEYEKNNHIDILLCAEKILEDAEGTCKADYIIALTERSYAAEKMDESVIFKYQSTEKIMHEILRVYGNRMRETEPVTMSNTKIICTCSPVGGSYSSTFSLGLAAYLAKSVKTLFLSFDPFFTIAGETKDPYENNLSDVIYYLDQKGRNVCGHILSKVSHLNELDYISGSSHWFDIADLRPKHMHRMIEELVRSGVYERIVFDVGIIGAASMEVLMSAEKIYTPIGNYANSEKKIEEWKRQIEFCGQRELLEKVIEIKLPYDEVLAGSYNIETLLAGRTGRIIAEMEGRNYRN